MILKGSQRSGARQLSEHLLNDRDNDHVSLCDLRGFVAGDLHGALLRQFVFSFVILLVEIPLGILTAVVGTPFFIVLLARMRGGWS